MHITNNNQAHMCSVRVCTLEYYCYWFAAISSSHVAAEAAMSPISNVILMKMLMSRATAAAIFDSQSSHTFEMQSSKPMQQLFSTVSTNSHCYKRQFKN